MLKHPRVVLGKSELDQVKEYMSVILGEDEFNATNMTWEFYLVGNSYNDYIERKLENAAVHGEPHLVYKVSKDRNYRIYVLEWSEVVTNFELRHSFLLDKLKLERRRLASSDSPDGTLLAGSHNTARTTKSDRPLIY